jgi:hypothetical protein
MTIGGGRRKLNRHKKILFYRGIGFSSPFLALTFSLYSLLLGLARSRIPQHSQNNLSVKK